MEHYLYMEGQHYDIVLVKYLYDLLSPIEPFFMGISISADWVAEFKSHPFNTLGLNLIQSFFFL